MPLAQLHWQSEKEREREEKKEAEGEGEREAQEEGEKERDVIGLNEYKENAAVIEWSMEAKRSVQLNYEPWKKVFNTQDTNVIRINLLY